MEKLTFRESRKFIEALKKRAVFLGAKGHEVRSKLEEQDLNEKVIIATSKKHRLILVATEEGFEGFHFNENELERYEILGSFDAYLQESYNFSIFEIDTQKLSLFLKSTPKSLITLHEDIDFELGLRYRTSLNTPDVQVIIYYWQTGPMLLIYKKNGKEVISLSEARSNIEGEEAIQRIQSQYKTVPCTMKVLRSEIQGTIVTSSKTSAITLDPDLKNTQRYEKDLLVLPFEDDDEAILTSSIFEESKVSMTAQESLLYNEDSVEETLYNEDSVETSEMMKEELPEMMEEELPELEDSVVMSAEELPELGPEDLDIFKKYGIEAPVNLDTKKRLASDYLPQSIETKPILNASPSLDTKKQSMKTSSIPKMILNVDTKRHTSSFAEQLPSIKQEPIEDTTNEKEINEAFLEPDEEKVNEALLESGLTQEEKEILEKYGLDVDINFEDEMVEDLEESVVLRQESLPEIGMEDIGVLAKYGIALAGTAGRATSMVNKNDVAILSHYNIILPNGTNSTLEEIQEAYNIAKTTNKLPSTVAPQDRVVFTKFGLDIPQKQIKIQFNIKYLIIPISIFLFILMSSVALKIWKAKRLEQEIRSHCLERTDFITQTINTGQEKITVIKDIIEKLKKNYPKSQGYPEPSPNLMEHLAQTEKFILNLKILLRTAEEKLIEDVRVAEEYLFTMEMDDLLQEENTDQAEQLTERFKLFYTTVEFMHKQEEKRRQIRTACRILREQKINGEQKVKALEENWKNLQEKYPESQGFPPRPQGVEQTIRETKAKNRTLYQNLRALEIAMIGNLDSALLLMEEQQKKDTHNFAYLEGLNGSILDITHLCANMAAKQSLQKRTVEIMTQINNTIDQVEKHFDKIAENKDILDEFPDDLEIPRPDKDEKELLSQLQQEYNTWNDGLQNARKLVHQNQFEEAEKFMLNLLKKEYPVKDLERIQLNMQDAITIAKGMQERSELGKQIAKAMRQAKEQSIVLKNYATEITQYQEQCQKLYPTSKDYPAHNIAFQVPLSNAKQMAENLNIVLKKVEDSLGQKNPDKALQILQSNINLVEQSRSIAPTLQTIKESFITKMNEYKIMAEQKQTIADIRKYKTKVETYLTELQEQFKPLAQSVEDYNANYASLADAAKIPDEVNKALEHGKNQIEFVNDTIKKGNRLSNALKYPEALEYWEQQDTGRLINREVIIELGKHRYRMEDLVFEAKQIQERKNKIDSIANLLKMIQHRLNQLQSTHEELQRNINLAHEKYPASQGFTPIDVNAESACHEAIAEIKELTEAIRRGEDLMQSAQYDEVVRLLKIYENPAMTKLPFVEQINRNVQKNIRDNERIMSDASFRQQIEIQKRQHAQKQEQRKKWRKSPGSWYNELASSLQKFNDVHDQLKISLKGSTSANMYPRVLSGINELKRIPDEIAELQEMIQEIENNNCNVLQMLTEKEEKALIPRVAREAKNAKQFFHSREIPVDLGTQATEFRELIDKIYTQLMIHKEEWVNDQYLKDLNKTLRGITDKYSDAHKSIYSMYTNLLESSKNNH
ncbi:MAG: hypothetical protein KBC30_04230 [Planctomycetes bacterium]|nr:hypothetical protein [Planctomycetota bacterium]HPY74594.1 hypothetical protein [Planctomycetota bacterium]HQB00234.1 hypothetical protein [Planctomycetota bacterium]